MRNSLTGFWYSKTYSVKYSMKLWQTWSANDLFVKLWDDFCWKQAYMMETGAFPTTRWVFSPGHIQSYEIKLQQKDPIQT